VRAARLELPLALAIIGGQTERFVPFAELHRNVWRELGHAGEPRLAINTHAFVADSRKAADRAFASGYLGVMNRIGRERGWPPSGRAEYEALAGSAGPLAVGSPEEVAEKIVRVHELFRPERYLAHMSIGAVEHRDVMRAIELFGTQVAPLVGSAIDPVPSAGSRT
jgi:alkanesulfonate monooxygenase SsuD/methylene tetrahydromethanopterin reductase-like flavin-dependent oxidoreductase (luciferase family)